jgi:hypothetical protein
MVDPPEAVSQQKSSKTGSREGRSYVAISLFIGQKCEKYEA